MKTIRGYLVASPCRTRFLCLDDQGEAEWCGVETARVFGTEERARWAASLETEEEHVRRIIVPLHVGVAIHAPVFEDERRVPDVPAWVHQPELVKSNACRCDECTARRTRVKGRAA